MHIINLVFLNKLVEFVLQKITKKKARRREAAKSAQKELSTAVI